MATKSSTSAKKVTAPAPARQAVKPPAGVTAKTSPETVTLKSVFEKMAETHDLPKKKAHELMAEMVDLFTTHLKHGDRIRMSGIGIIEVKDRPARMGRNPATGQPIQIAPSRKVGFRPAKELKAVV